MMVRNYLACWIAGIALGICLSLIYMVNVKARPAPVPAAPVRVDSVAVTDNALLIAATEMADSCGWLVFSVNHILPQHGGGVMLHFVKDTMKGEK